MIQHITFSVDFRNVEAADRRYNKITNLTFGGVVFDAASHDDEKEAAIEHVWNNVLPDEGIFAQFGNILPLFGTFRLLKVTTPSDQAMA